MLDAILKPLEIVVAWLMVGWHTILSGIGLPAESGWTWALSIVGLVIVIRIVLIPLFVKQINASRGLQLIQPEMKKIQEKYKGKSDPESRQKMTQETMALYKDTGTNPFASCLPIILQAPVFFALFRVLNNIKTPGFSIGPLSNQLREQANNATLLGAKLSSTFTHAGGNVSVQVLTVALIVLMSISTFTTQRQLMTKNMPAAALNNSMAQQQKILMYVLPLIFAVSGVNFPIGVLLYWLTTNVWSMGQQFYVIRRRPAPGSLAEKQLEERRRRKGAPTPPSSPGSNGTTGGGAGGPAGASPDGGTASTNGTAEQPRASGQRQQPKRQPRDKRRGAAPPPSAPRKAPRQRRDNTQPDPG